MKTINAFDARELATVLAALRYWQTDMDRLGGFNAAHDHIATGAGTFDALTEEEIDTLCERINTSGNPEIAIILEGGLVQCVVTDGDIVGLSYEVIDYDTDGGDEADFYGVPQEDGSISDAYVSGGSVSLATINLSGIKPLAEFNDDQEGTEELLTAELRAWQEQNGLPCMCAFEQMSGDVTPEQLAWLKAFNQRWDACMEGRTNG